MVRFGAKADDGDSPDEPTSFKQLARSADETRFDTDLSQVESDVEDFGVSGTEGFSSAWSTAPEVEGAELLAHEEEQRGDKRASRLRDLDRGVSVGRVVTALLVVSAIVAGFIFFDRFAELGQQSAAEDDPFQEAFLVAPGEARTYAEAGDVLRVDSGWPVGDTFIADGPSSDPNPTPPETVTLPTGVVAAPLVWGGRAHIAIIGPGVGADDLCAVTSLFSANLDVIDIAADGAARAGSTRRVTA